MKVKRCPFCNSHNLSLEISAAAYQVKCFGCFALGPAGLTKESAVGFWNGRHRHTNPSALVANRKSNHHEMKEVDL